MSNANPASFLFGQNDFFNKTALTGHCFGGDMAHNGFTDLKYAVKSRALVGKQDADIAADNLKKAHIDFLDRYFKIGDSREEKEKFPFAPDTIERCEIL